MVSAFVVPTLRLRSGQVPAKSATDGAAAFVVAHRWASPQTALLTGVRRSGSTGSNFTHKGVESKSLSWHFLEP